MGSDGADQAMAIGGADEKPSTRSQNAGQFVEACGRTIHVFNDMVVENCVEPFVFKRKLANAGDLKLSSRLRFGTWIDKIFDIDGVDIRIQAILNRDCLVTGTAACDKYLWRNSFRKTLLPQTMRGCNC